MGMMIIILPVVLSVVLLLVLGFVVYTIRAKRKAANAWCDFLFVSHILICS